MCGGVCVQRGVCVCTVCPLPLCAHEVPGSGAPAGRRELCRVTSGGLSWVEPEGSRASRLCPRSGRRRSQGQGAWWRLLAPCGLHLREFRARDRRPGPGPGRGLPCVSLAARGSEKALDKPWSSVLTFRLLPCPTKWSPPGPCLGPPSGIFLLFFMQAL